MPDPRTRLQAATERFVSEVLSIAGSGGLASVQAVARLRRRDTSDDGTFGVLVVDLDGDQREFKTLELPWRENRRSVSCIPAGRYHCRYRKTSKRIGGVDSWYEVENVPGRSGILIHPGNWAGDESKGKKSDVEGCILLGRSVDVIQGQRGVTSSQLACADFVEFLDREDFWLEISD